MVIKKKYLLGNLKIKTDTGIMLHKPLYVGLWIKLFKSTYWHLNIHYSNSGKGYKEHEQQKAILFFAVLFKHQDIDHHIAEMV